MSPTVLFLNALGQALAAMSLYAPTHPMRSTARERALELLRVVLTTRGPLRLSFLDGDVVVGTRVMPELRGWDWGMRFSRAGIQRLEVDDLPPPTDEQLDALLHALHEQLAAPAGAAFSSFDRGNLRAGPITVAEDATADSDAVGDLLDAIAHEGLDEEADAVRWIHDEAAGGRAIPMAEVEAVVRSLASAMHRDQHVVLPLLELKTVDQYTTTHSCNVAMLSMGLAEQVGLSSTEVREIGTAALLHDIGKVRVPPEILVKPGKLSNAEFELMRRHPVDGARMLAERGRGHSLAAIVAYEHHVWEDGRGGYPHFAFARRCHYASRLVHVCDLYDALSTRRPYRDAWPRERTLAMLQAQSGLEVDAELVDAFITLANNAEQARFPLHETPQNDWTAAVTRAAEAWSPGGELAPQHAATPNAIEETEGTIPQR
jgi:putative nucleotidyltransferase with HDIG domain